MSDTDIDYGACLVAAVHEHVTTIEQLLQILQAANLPPTRRLEDIAAVVQESQEVIDHWFRPDSVLAETSYRPSWTPATVTETYTITVTVERDPDATSEQVCSDLAGCFAMGLDYRESLVASYRVIGPTDSPTQED